MYLPTLKKLLYYYYYYYLLSQRCFYCDSGGTDIISCFAGNNPTLPVFKGEIQCRLLGMAVESWDDDGLLI